MTSVRRAVNNLASELNLFTSELTHELDELKRNVEIKPVTGATLYRHCLEDLDERAASLGEDLSALEAVSLDAISLEELVGHCAALYSANHRAIAALETRLRSYGYRDVYSPLPPENPLDLMGILNLSARKPAAHNNKDDDDDTADLISADLIPTGYYGGPNDSPQLKMSSVARHQPPTTISRHRNAALQAMAPMTAAKTRALHKGDTPSSLSSVELMSPSMRMLMGKYATGSSSGGSLQLSLPGCAPTMTPGRISVSPMMLSPAFQKAAEFQRQQMPAAAVTKEPSPAVPSAVNNTTQSPLVEVLQSLDTISNKYNTQVEQVHHMMTDPIDSEPMAPRHFDEESTMELKAQVIFSRQAAEAREAASKLVQNQQQTSIDHFSFPSLAPSSVAMGTSVAVTPGDSMSGGGNSNSGTTSSGAPASSLAFPAPVTTGRESIMSVKSVGALSTGKRGLPEAVPALKLADEADYSSLPPFIRGQLSLEALNETAKVVHSLVTRRCAAKESPGFTMDDVEATGVIPVGKGKVFANALVKLGYVQLRVVYGQGTVYFFV